MIQPSIKAVLKNDHAIAWQGVVASIFVTALCGTTIIVLAYFFWDHPIVQLVGGVESTFVRALFISAVSLVGVYTERRVSMNYQPVTKQSVNKLLALWIGGIIVCVVVLIAVAVFAQLKFAK